MGTPHTLHRGQEQSSLAVFFTAPTEKQSIQESSHNLVDRLDPRLRSLLLALFPDPERDGLAFLTALCQQATETTTTLVPGQQPVPVALTTCQGVPGLLQKPGWKWSRETTLIMLQTLETLTILVRVRRARRTEIHIPLGERTLDRAVLLARLEACPLKNRKAQKLIQHIAARLRQIEWPWATPTHEATPGKPVSSDTHPLYTVLAILEHEGVSRSLQARLAFRLGYAWPYLASLACPPDLQVLAEEHNTQKGAILDKAGNHNLSSQGEIQPLSASIESATDVVDAPVTPMPPPSLGTPREMKITQTTVPVQTEQERERRMLPAESFHTQPEAIQKRHTEEQRKIPTDDKSSYRNKSSKRTATVSPVPDGLDVDTEALEVWTYLTIAEQRRSLEGDQLLKQILKWTTEHPALVRLALINTFMQRIFPDRYGSPEGSGARWFAKSFRMYQAQRLYPSSEIASWAQSPYSYEEIEAALWDERRYQEQSGQQFQRPHAPLPNEVYPQANQQEVATRIHPTQQSFLPMTVDHHLEEMQPAGRTITSPEGEILPEEATLVRDDVLVVDDPNLGWSDDTGLRWAYENLRETPLGSSCSIQMLTTQHGRTILKTIPHDDPSQARIWSSSRDVRLYLEEVQAARIQQQPDQKSFDKFSYQLQMLKDKYTKGR